MQEEIDTDKPVHIHSGDDLEEIVSVGDVVLVDFYADWCGPCRLLEPILEQVAAKTEAVVAKIDIDEQRGLATAYQVRSVPTMVLFVDGTVVEQLVGVQDEKTLTERIEEYAR